MRRKLNVRGKTAKERVEGTQKVKVFWMKEKVKVWLLQDRLVAEAISRESANSEKLARAKPPQVFFSTKRKVNNRISALHCTFRLFDVGVKKSCCTESCSSHAVDPFAKCFQRNSSQIVTTVHLSFSQMEHIGRKIHIKDGGKSNHFLTL